MCHQNHWVWWRYQMWVISFRQLHIVQRKVAISIVSRIDTSKWASHLTDSRFTSSECSFLSLHHHSTIYHSAFCICTQQRRVRKQAKIYRFCFSNTSKVTFWNEPRAKSQSLDPIALGANESSMLQQQPMLQAHTQMPHNVRFLSGFYWEKCGACTRAVLWATSKT